MNFILATDLHLVPTDERFRSYDPFERLDVCLKDIEPFQGDAAFCFHSGDLTERRLDQVRHLFFGHVYRTAFGSWRGIPYSASRA